jgi:hypothetical protein
MAKKNPRLKVKTIEVSARSLFGRPSEMDKTIEKWINQGWELKGKRKVRAKERYILNFEYSMSDEEFAAEKKRQRNRGLGCAALIGIVAIISSINASQKAAQEAPTRTYEAIIEGTRVAQVNATQRQQSIFDTATATLWTATFTASPTFTATITDTPTATHTASNTPLVTATPVARVATQIPATSAPPETYYTARNANARECSKTDCAVITTLPTGSEVTVVGWEHGDIVSGNDVWRVVVLNGRHAYIHSSLLTITPPQPTSAPQAVSPPISVVPVPVQPLPVSSSCDCFRNTLNCDDFNLQSEAQACFNKCMVEVGSDIHRLDGDNNNLACDKADR